MEARAAKAERDAQALMDLGFDREEDALRYAREYPLAAPHFLEQARSMGAKLKNPAGWVRRELDRYGERARSGGHAL